MTSSAQSLSEAALVGQEPLWQAPVDPNHADRLTQINPCIVPSRYFYSR